MIMEQSHSIPQNIKEEQKKIKADLKNKKTKKGKEQSGDLLKRLNSSLQRSATLSMEKGASNWLSALPLREHGFALHKGAFRDILRLRYGWRPPNLPERCVCGTAFSVEHAMSCPHGGFPIMRHNELRDMTAYLLSEVCCGVGTEPTLQPLANETLRYRTANKEEGAQLDIVAEDFWSHRQRAFFDVRVFNPFALSLRNTSLPSCYRQKEQEKRRAYDQRIRDIEHGSFTPLIFSASGGLGRYQLPQLRTGG